MARSRLLLASLVAIAVAPHDAAPRAQGASAPSRDFPDYDRNIASAVSNALEAKRLTQQLAKGDAGPEVIGWLVRTERFGEAVTMLRRTVAAKDAGRIRAALDTISRLPVLRRDDIPGYVDTLREIIASVRTMLPALEREEAARLARSVTELEWQIRTGPNDWLERQRTIAAEYAGTDTALLAEVDVIEHGSEPLMARIDAFDRFAKAHLGTQAGAKALYQVGFQLAGNVATSGLERRGSDPTDRFFRLLDVVNELESDRYPAGEWRDKALDLISSFFVSSTPPPAYSPANIARTLDAYKQVVFKYAGRVTTEDIAQSLIGYIVTSRMAPLYGLTGSAVAGTEQFLSEFEAHASDKAAVRLFRGQYYMQQATGGSDANRPAMLDKARSALSALAAEKNGYASRKALACLAALAYYLRDDDRALPLFEQYVTTYPTSSWTWLASLRIGRVYEAREDWKAAADQYQRAAKAFGSESFAGVVGHSSAARAFEALGRFDEALGEYRLARAAWDDDHGREYSITSSQAPLPQQTAGRGPITRPVDPTVVTKVQLDERVAMLTRAFAMPGGAIFMRGRGELDRGQFADARETFARFLTDFPGSVAAGEARELMHRAQLEHALRLASPQNPAADMSAASAALSDLAREPFDNAVGIGEIAAVTLLATRGSTLGAADQLRAALSHLVEAQRARLLAPPPGSIEADIVAIRDLVFTPTGNLAVFSGVSWNAFEFPRQPPLFMVVSADTPVRLFDRTMTTPRVYQRYAGLDNIIQLTADELAILERVIPTLGGTATRTPGQVMETPNQPIGTARDIVALWNELFPTRAGHWGGFEVTAYPRVTRIEFLDAARTKANALVTVGYSGATVVLEKISGRWVAVRLTSQWVT